MNTPPTNPTTVPTIIHELCFGLPREPVKPYSDTVGLTGASTKSEKWFYTIIFTQFLTKFLASYNNSLDKKRPLVLTHL